MPRTGKQPETSACHKRLKLIKRAYQSPILIRQRNRCTTPAVSASRLKTLLDKKQGAGNPLNNFSLEALTIGLRSEIMLFVSKAN